MFTIEVVFQMKLFINTQLPESGNDLLAHLNLFDEKFYIKKIYW